MLLNLLNAIFTAVFEDVQENSKEVWKYEMYRLVKEYGRKSSQPVPFTILGEFYRMCSYALTYCTENDPLLVEHIRLRNQKTLDSLENDCLNMVLSRESKQEDDIIESKMSQLEQKMAKTSWG